MHALALALLLAAPAEPPLRMAEAPPVSLWGGEALAVGNAQVVAWAGWPRLGFLYAQGLGGVDLGLEADLSWNTGELTVAPLLRLPLWRQGASALALRGRIGLYACFAAGWGRYERQPDGGLLLSPGLAWSTAAGSATVSAGLDLWSAATFRRGGGLWVAPALTAAVEVPLAGEVTLGARMGAWRRWHGGGAPGADGTPENGGEFSVLLGYRLF